MIIPKLIISGTLMRVGDCVQDNPGIIIHDNEGNKILLSVTKEEAKMLAPHLYKKIYLTFDAKIEIGNE